MSDQDEEFVPTKEEIEKAINGGGTTATAVEPELEALADLTQEEKTIGLRIMPRLVGKITAQANAASAKKLMEQVQQLNEQNRRMMTEEVAKIRKSMAPPDAKQLETLLSQEYGVMEVEVKQRNGEKKCFTLRELPQEAEKKMFDIIAKRIVPHLRELAAVEWAASATYADKIQKGLSVIPDGLDMLAECAVICLNPYGEEAIDLAWVQKNMGSSRIMNVVNAQVEVSKLRDFFSDASHLLRQ